MSAPVYIRIQRPEGYEDVHPNLVIEDAIPNGAAWQAEDVTAHVERLEAALMEYAVASDRYCDAGEPQSRYYDAGNAALAIGREIAGRKP